MAHDPRRPRVRLVTFGCRVNQYETEMMRRLLSADFEPTDGAAEVVVVNACTVTSPAERKARQAVARAHRELPEAKVVLIGCLAEAVARRLADAGDVDLVAGQAWKTRVADVVRRALHGETGLLGQITPQPIACERIEAHPGRVRAFLKVEDGCSQSCSFCRTTQVRGHVRSKPIASAVEEARHLVSNGYPEIVLTGVNLALYAPPHGNLAELLRGVLSVDGLLRLRLGSLNLSGVRDELLDVFVSDRRACPHFHLPLQSGDDGILRRMGRNYTASTYLAALARIRAALPEATFGADILVGFPGEDEKAFAATLSLVEAAQFANLHVFRYSPRCGTEAASMSPAVSEAVRRERAERVQALAQTIRRQLGLRLVGTTEEILVESRRGRSVRGHTRGYLEVMARDDGAARPGAEVAVRILTATEESLQGVTEYRRNMR